MALTGLIRKLWPKWILLFVFWTIIGLGFAGQLTRYRGLAKNTAQFHSLFALANLVIARRSLLTIAAA